MLSYDIILHLTSYQMFSQTISFSEFLGYSLTFYSHIQRKYDFFTETHWFSLIMQVQGISEKNQNYSIKCTHCLTRTLNRIFQREYNFFLNSEFVRSRTGAAWHNPRSQERCHFECLNIIRKGSRYFSTAQLEQGDFRTEKQLNKHMSSKYTRLHWKI